jgi:hypothetical protein
MLCAYSRNGEALTATDISNGNSDYRFYLYKHYEPLNNFGAQINHIEAKNESANNVHKNVMTYTRR